MKNFLKNLTLFRAKAVRLDKLFPVSAIRRACPRNLEKLVCLSLGKASSVSSRVRSAYNFIDFILKMNKNHGSSYTVKWLKASHVALQKYVGGDKINSLRVIEPNVPLPRLINGCPAIINRQDRRLIREGHAGLTRYWLSLFGIYRILRIKGVSKLGTIYGPFTGSAEKLVDLLAHSRKSGLIYFKRLEKFPKVFKLAPMAFIFSHKASPSNKVAFTGILSDYALLTKKYDLFFEASDVFGSDDHIWENLNNYLNVIKKTNQLARWRSLVSGVESLIGQIQELGYKLPIKRSGFGSRLSQFAIKEEAAGKVRVFALVDSWTQSVLKPLHEALFQILRSMPNDGTFNQDASVQRSIDKAAKYGCAFSFDLSAATDRLPAHLTAQILESIFAIEGLGEAWYKLLVDRHFHFGESVVKKYPHFWEDQDNAYRYSVGQPMGGLSSWAGLAITHHWILQYCSNQLGNLTVWEDRYEVLGDDIVIFDRRLASKYLEVMKDLGVDINISKSISSLLPVFEFAKRTVVKGVNVSTISFKQLLSQSGIQTRVADSYKWMTSGLINSLPVLGLTLSKFGNSTSFRKLREVGLPALSLLGLLHSKGAIEHRIVVESLVNPRYEDFDFEKAKFLLPLRATLHMILEICTGKAYHTYPFSGEPLRNEVFKDNAAEMTAVVLQLALHKAKLLLKDKTSLLQKGSRSMVHIVGPVDKIFLAGLEGWWEDNITNWEDIDVDDLVDEVEDILYSHAKVPKMSFEDALSLLDKVEGVIFKFTFNTDKSRRLFETDTSPVVDLLRKTIAGSKTRYWDARASDD
jgi:hypothetical protein